MDKIGIKLRSTQLIKHLNWTSIYPGAFLIWEGMRGELLRTVFGCILEGYPAATISPNPESFAGRVHLALNIIHLNYLGLWCCWEKKTTGLTWEVRQEEVRQIHTQWWNWNYEMVPFCLAFGKPWGQSQILAPNVGPTIRPHLYESHETTFSFKQGILFAASFSHDLPILHIRAFGTFGNTCGYFSCVAFRTLKIKWKLASS